MCEGQPKGISDEEYKTIFIMLEPDEMGNLSYKVLINYLTSLYSLSGVAVLAILHDFDEKNTNVFNAHQFVVMMKKLNGIHKSVAELCKKLFPIYDTNNDGYVDMTDLNKIYSLNSVYRTDIDVLKTIRRFDTNEDDKLNFVDFTEFYINQ